MCGLFKDDVYNSDYEASDNWIERIRKNRNEAVVAQF
jgi:hypothetical protein